MEKNFFVNFKFYDLTNGKNECIRFGGHADIEANYKILRLEILYEALIFLNPPWF
jgi:hypothetical protein